jgi:hypothetical protein
MFTPSFKLCRTRGFPVLLVCFGLTLWMMGALGMGPNAAAAGPWMAFANPPAQEESVSERGRMLWSANFDRATIIDRISNRSPYEVVNYPLLFLLFNPRKERAERRHEAGRH